MHQDNKNNVLSLIVLLLFGFVQGCQYERHQDKQQSYQLDASPSLLYLKEQPYQQLYVEVDTLEGTKVPETFIKEIRSFLSQYCSKPDGIKIVQDTPVSFEQDELSIGLMSLLCLDGPIGFNENEQPAYLHIFLYNTDAKNIIYFATNPYIDARCATTVFFNTSYTKRFHDSLAIFTLKHEIGHVLGLCTNTSHGYGFHCQNNGCLMHKSPSLVSQLTTLIQIPIKDFELCTDCQNDINNAKSLSPKDSMLFKGPFLLEHKADSSVMSLPYYNMPIPKDAIASLDWKALLSKLKNYIRSNTKQLMSEIKSKHSETILRGIYKP